MVNYNISTVLDYYLSIKLIFMKILLNMEIYLNTLNMEISL